MVQAHTVAYSSTACRLQVVNLHAVLLYATVCACTMVSLLYCMARLFWTHRPPLMLPATTDSQTLSSCAVSLGFAPLLLLKPLAWLPPPPLLPPDLFHYADAFICPGATLSLPHLHTCAATTLFILSSDTAQHATRPSAPTATPATKGFAAAGMPAERS